MNIVEIYEDLKKYVNTEKYDDMFYNAPEGEIQEDIVREILLKIISLIS